MSRSPQGESSLGGRVTVPVCPSPTDKARLLGLNPAVWPPECLVLCESRVPSSKCADREKRLTVSSRLRELGRLRGAGGPPGRRWCSSISGCLLGKPLAWEAGLLSHRPSPHKGGSPWGDSSASPSLPTSVSFSPSTPCKVTHKPGVPGVGAGVSEAPHRAPGLGGLPGLGG